MLKEKNAELVKNLNQLIKKYSRNDKVRKIIIEEFISRNMRATNAMNILNENLELSTLDIETNKDLVLLYVFNKGMYKAMTFKENKDDETLGEIQEGLSIISSDYFTDVEITNLNDYKLEKTLKKDEPIVFPNMIEVNGHTWVGLISSKLLAKLDAGNEFIYNFKTQRDPVIDIYGMKRIRLDKSKAEEITNNLLSGDQFPSAICVNVLKDDVTDDVRYDPKTRNLIVYSGIKNIFDGFHRKISNSIAISKNSDLEFNWILIITNMSENMAQKQMVEINKQKPINQEHVKNMDTSSLGNAVVNAIKDIDISEFATKIKDNDRELEYGGLTKKSILAVAIEECYEITDKTQARSIARHIADVIDHIIGLYTNEFIKNLDQTKKYSYINHKNMFYGYIALSRKLFGVKNWEDKIKEMLDKIDFSKNNEFWNDIKLCEQDMNKTSRKDLYKLFENLV
jgi:hypothetical protein